MPPNDLRALCVSIHDVSPHTWPQCEMLLQALASVADIPLTLLVVPDWHRQRVTTAERRRFERAIERRIAHGDELVLHGYAHVDEGPPPRTLAERFWRRIYTLNEGEFSALDAAEARRRIDAGLAWFSARGWPVEGFVAPAWLVSAGTWQALSDSPFLYTTTLRHFHLLHQGRTLTSPSLVYAARNAAGRLVSHVRNAWLAHVLCDAPLVRFGLHPADTRHPGLMRHCRDHLAALLPHRQALTKAAFARRVQ